MSIQLLAGTAIIHENKLLLLKQRSDGDQPNKWGPPAGHGEDNESPSATAIRETKEETNLDVELLGISQCGILTHKNKDYALVIYVARARNMELLKKQDKEVADYVWASLKDLREGKFPLRKGFLKEPLVLAMTRKPLPINSFEVYFVEKD